MQEALPAFRISALCAALLFAPVIRAADPAFEAISVKMADQCAPQNVIDASHVALHGDPLKAIVAEAYSVASDQIDGPSWLDTSCITIDAKMPDGATKDQLPAMYRSLLQERLKLAAHEESRTRAGYDLVVDRNGPKFKASDANPGSARMPAGQVRFGAGSANAGIKGSMTIANLARYLSLRLSQPVQDLTGLIGKFDIDLAWVPDQVLQNSGAFAENSTLPNPAGADLFKAIQESLGLKLEAAKQSVKTIVIDRIERTPTGN